jgi:hypothetical protein
VSLCVCRGAISSFETPYAQSILQFVHQVVINKLNTLCGRRGRGGSNPPGRPQVIIIMKSPVLCCMKIMSRATKALHSIIELLIIMNNNTDTYTHLPHNSTQQRSVYNAPGKSTIMHDSRGCSAAQ